MLTFVHLRTGLTLPHHRGPAHQTRTRCTRGLKARCCSLQSLAVGGAVSGAVGGAVSGAAGGAVSGAAGGMLDHAFFMLMGQPGEDTLTSKPSVGTGCSAACVKLPRRVGLNDTRQVLEMGFQFESGCHWPQALWWALLLPLSVAMWAVSDLGLYGSEELLTSRCSSTAAALAPGSYTSCVPTSGGYTALRIGVALLWLVAVFAILNTARLRVWRSLVFLFTIIPISDLVACLKPFLAGEARAEDAFFLLFHFPPALAAVVAALVTYTQHGPIREWRYWFWFVVGWYLVCCSALYFWSGGRATRYPITYGPVEGAIATEVGLVAACLCLEFHEKLFPRSLQWNQGSELADVVGGELMSVVEASTQPHPSLHPTPHTKSTPPTLPIRV